MKYLISILIYIPGLISFLILAILVLTTTLLFDPYKCHPFIRLLCRLFLKACFIRVKVEGIEKIDPSKTYIFTSNHVNIFDVFLLTGYIPNLTRGVELESHFDWPIWGAMIKRYGNIPISHHNPKNALQSLVKAKEAFDKGVSIIILPEGHRTRDGKLLPFKKGPFYLAEKAKADIVTCAMLGSYKIKKVTSLHIRPGTITFKFGDVVPYETYKDITTAELKDLIRKKIQHLIKETE